VALGWLEEVVLEEVLETFVEVEVAFGVVTVVEALLVDVASVEEALVVVAVTDGVPGRH
jgi:hypothetical protein